MTHPTRTDDRPPPTRKGGASDLLHGTQVADPYRWLEAGADDPDVARFIEGQNAFSERTLARLPDRRALRTRLERLWSRRSVGTPQRRGDTTFQFRREPGAEQDALYAAEGAGTPRLLLDPTALGGGGTTALSAVSPSPDGRYVAFALSHEGSDWRSWYVLEVAGARRLDDALHWSKFAGVAWHPNGEAFAYVAYPRPTAGGALTEATQAPEIRLHTVGDDQADDPVLYRPSGGAASIVWPAYAHGDDLLVVAVAGSSSGGNGIDLVRPGGEPETLVAVGDTHVRLVGRRGDELLFHTDDGAPRWRVVAVDPSGGQRRWRTVVAEGEDLLEHVRLVGDALVVARRHHGSHRLAILDLVGSGEREVELPEATVVSDRHAANPLDGERFGDAVTLSLTGYLTPPTPYRLDLASGTLSALQRPESDLDAERYLVERRFATSRDGTEVPLFVVRRRDLPPGPRPTLLYGYGGFGVVEGPRYRPDWAAWIEQGGVLASALLRGGGEYGSAWHDAGRLSAKQNVFDDFIGCAEHLIASGVSAADRLAIEGRSNGGLLVGACLTQRPELFAAAVPAVGVLDMLRYHRFTIGWAWASDYGTADDPEQFATLLSYSPLHAIRDGTAYPATLIETADHDDRVVPAHSFKFAAALQAAQGGDAPILLRVTSGAGHGFGKPVSLHVEEAASRLAFLRSATEGWT